MQNYKFTLSAEKPTTTNVLEGARERLQDNPFFNMEDWETIRKGAIEGINLSSYVNTLAGAKAMIPDVDSFKKEYSYDNADTFNRFGALFNEVNKDELSKSFTGSQDGDEPLSDYEYNKALYKSNAEFFDLKHARELDAVKKQEMNAFSKYYATIGAIAGRGYAGALGGVNDILSFISGVGAALAMTQYELATNKKIDEEGRERIFKAFTDEAQGTESVNGLIRFLKNSEEEFVQNIAEFESKYTFNRDINGNYTGFGKYVGGAVESFMRQVPSMLIGMGAGKVAAGAGAAAETAAKVSSGVSQATFYAGLMSGDVAESYQTITERGGSVTYTSLVCSSALKAGAQWLVEREVGALSDAFGLGGSSMADVVAGRGKASALTGSNLTKNGALRILVKDPIQEGVEEVLQDVSDFYINKLFSQEKLAYGFFDNDFGKLCVDENGKSALTFQSCADSFIIAALMSIGGSAVNLVKSRIRQNSEVNPFVKDLNVLAYNEYNITLESFSDNFKALNDIVEQYYESNVRDVKIEKSITNAFGKLYETYRMVASIYGEIGEERVNKANTVLSTVSEYIREGRFDKGFIQKMAKEAFDGLREYKTPDGRQVFVAEGFLEDFEKSIEKFKENQIANIKEVSTPDSEASNNVEQLADQLRASDDRVKNVAISESGTNAVAIENEKGERTIIVPEAMSELGFNAVANSIAQTDIIQGLIKAPSAELQGALKTLLKRYRISNPGATVEQMIADLLFTDAKGSFYRECVPTAEKETLRIFAEIAKTAIRLQKSAPTLKDIEGKVNGSPYEIKNLKTAVTNMSTCLQEYYTGHPEATIPNGLFSNKVLETIKSERFTPELSNRLILDGADKLNEKEQSILTKYVANAPGVTPDEKAVLLSKIFSDTSANRATAVLRLNELYNGSFYSMYDGNFYLREESYGNSVFNTALKTFGLYAKDVAALVKEGNIEAYANFINYFNKISGELFDVETVGDSFLIIPKEDSVDRIAMRNQYLPVDGKDTRLIRSEDQTSIRWMIRKEVSSDQISHLGITDVINNPIELLSPGIKDAIVDEYGAVTPYNTFLYLRESMISRKRANKESPKKTIIKLRDGTYAFADLVNYKQGIPNDFKGFPDKEDLRIKDLGFTSFYENSYLKDIRIVFQSTDKTNQGYYDSRTRTITIPFERDSEAALNSFLHEVQHAVQFANNQIGGFSPRALVQDVGSGKYTYLNEDAKKVIDYVWKRYFGGDKAPTSSEIARVAMFIYNGTGEADARGDDLSVQMTYYPTLVNSDSESFRIALFDGSYFEVKKSVTGSEKLAVLASHPEYNAEDDYGSPFAIIGGKAVRFDEASVCDRFGRGNEDVTYMSVNSLIPTRKTYNLMIADGFSLENDRALLKSILEPYVKNNQQVYLYSRKNQGDPIVVSDSVDNALNRFAEQSYVDGSVEELYAGFEDLPSDNLNLSSEESKTLARVIESNLLRNNEYYRPLEEELVEEGWTRAASLDEFRKNNDIGRRVQMLIASNKVTPLNHPDAFIEAPTVSKDSRFETTEQENAEIAQSLTEKKTNAKERKNDSLVKLETAKGPVSVKEANYDARNEKLREIINSKDVRTVDGRITLNATDVSKTALAPFLATSKGSGRNKPLQTTPAFALFLLDAASNRKIDSELIESINSGNISSRDVTAYFATHPDMSQETFDLIKEHFYPEQTHINSREEVEKMAGSADAIYCILKLLDKYSSGKSLEEKALTTLGVTNKSINNSIKEKGLSKTVLDLSKAIEANSAVNELYTKILEDLSKTKDFSKKDFDNPTLVTSFMKNYKGTIESARGTIMSAVRVISSENLRFAKYGRSVESKSEADLSSGSANAKGESSDYDIENVGSEGEVQSVIRKINLDEFGKDIGKTAKRYLNELLGNYIDYGERAVSEIGVKLISYLNKQKDFSRFKGMSLDEVMEAAGISEFAKMKSEIASLGRTVANADSVKASIRRYLRQANAVVASQAKLTSTGKLNKTLEKKIRSIEGFDKYFTLLDGTDGEYIAYKSPVSDTTGESNRGKNEFVNLAKKATSISEVLSNMKTVFQAREDANERTLRESKRLVEKSLSEIERLKSENKQLQKESATLKTSKPTARIEYVNNTRLQLSSTSPMPEVIQRVLNNDNVSFSDTNVKAYEDLDIEHVNTGPKAFYEKILKPELEKLSTEELVELANYMADTGLIASGDTEAFSKFMAIQQYAIVYLTDRDRRHPFLSAELADKLRTRASIAISDGGSMLQYAKFANQTIHPYLETMESYASELGITLRESDFDAIEAAVKANEQDKLVEALGNLKAHLAEDNALRMKDRSVLEKIQKWQQLMMLSSPTTWARNQVSNVVISVSTRAGAFIGDVVTRLVEKDGDNALSKMDAIEKTLSKESWTKKDIKSIKNYFQNIGVSGKITVGGVTLDAYVALDTDPNDPNVRKFFSVKSEGPARTQFGAVRKALDNQYKILGKDINEKLKTEEYENLHKSLILNFKKGQENSIFNLVFESTSKYDARSEGGKFDTAKRTAEYLVQRLTDDIVYNKDFFGAKYARNNVEKFLASIGNEAGAFVSRMISDNLYVKRRTVYYLERIMAQYGLTEKDVSFENSKFVKYFADSYTMAARDYMHKANFINDLENKLKKYNQKLWFAYKQVFPFASSSWNWALAGMMDLSPIGLAKSIYDFANLERQVVKYAQLSAEGKDTTPYRFAKYAAKRGIGMGALGSVGLLAGLTLAALGFARIDEQDDKWKLSIADKVYIDISDLFGSQGIYSGIVVGGLLRDFISNPIKGMSPEESVNARLKNVEKIFSSVADVMFSGSLIDDLYSSFRYTQSLGDYAVGLTSKPFEMMLPSFCYAVEALNPYKLKYSAGFKGKLQQMVERATLGIPSVVNAIGHWDGWELGPDFTVDPYTGERQLPYGTKWWSSMLLKSLGKASQINVRVVSDAEKEAVNLGLRKSMLSGKYTVGEDKLTLSHDEIVYANEYYGQLNKSDLDALKSNRVKYTVLNPETGKMQELYYRQMTDKQKATVIDRLMSNNSGYTKIYMLTSTGKYKYFASESEYRTLRQLGITKNVYKKTKRLDGFVKIS